MRETLVLLVLTNIVSIANTTGSVLAAVATGAGISEVRLFRGHRIAGLTIRGVCVQIGWVPVGAFVEFGEGNLKADCYGEKYDPARHRLKTGIKSATYYMLEVDKDNNRVQVIFDV